MKSIHSSSAGFQFSGNSRFNGYFWHYESQAQRICISEKNRSCFLASSSWNFRGDWEKPALVKLQKAHVGMQGLGPRVAGRSCSQDTWLRHQWAQQLMMGIICMGSLTQTLCSLPLTHRCLFTSLSWPTQGNGNMHWCFNRLFLVHLQIFICAGKMPCLHYKE